MGNPTNPLIRIFPTSTFNFPLVTKPYPPACIESRGGLWLPSGGGRPLGAILEESPDTTRQHTA